VVVTVAVAMIASYRRPRKDRTNMTTTTSPTR